MIKHFRFKRLFTYSIISLLILSMLNAFGFEIITVETHSKTASVEVLRLQERLIELNYFSYKPTGTYGRLSSTSIQRFQEVNELSPDGRIGEESYNLLFSSQAKRNPIPVQVDIPFGPTSSEAKADFGIVDDWETHVDMIFEQNKAYTLTDLNTGTTFSIQRVGGKKHAKIAPVDAEDTNAFLKIFGGEYNWSKRPVTVMIGESQYAASLQGMPYGSEQVENNQMTGSCDLYFQNSVSDTSGLLDEEHRNNVSRASGRW